MPADHFKRHYRDSDDPWDYAGRWYERRKYLLTAAALPRPTYDRAFEPGCSVGVLTTLLATRCRSLLSTDMEPRAVQLAAARVAGLSGVEVEERRVPEQWPAGTFDLIVLSELLYYLDEADIDRVVDHAQASLTEDGHLVLVHWRGVADDYVVAGGDAVHARVGRHRGFRPLVRHQEDDFLLDVLTPAPQPR